MALDFNETYMKRLNESFDLIANGVQYTWPGVGGMTIMNGGISWHSGNWSLYGGGFGGRFFSPFNQMCIRDRFSPDAYTRSPCMETFSSHCFGRS